MLVLPATDLVIVTGVPAGSVPPALRVRLPEIVIALVMKVLAGPDSVSVVCGSVGASTT